MHTYVYLAVHYFTVPAVSFEQQNYNVNETDGKVEPVLVLSKPSVADITVEVFSTDGSAAGKLLTILNLYTMTGTV